MVIDARQAIAEGRTALGIELGSTRIKAVLIGLRTTLRSRSAAMTGRTSSSTGSGPTPWMRCGPGCNSATPHLPPMCSNATTSS